MTKRTKAGRPPRKPNDEFIRALAQGGDNAKAGKILDMSRDAVGRRAARLGLVWAPVHEELLDEVTTLTLQHQRKIDES